ncbi:MAG: hypothetical protein A2271_00775 [Candidatus Moranbacteria bacterium RIFOXYA12_FULL_35_19]|nr:MAG: hypothetical protein A2343_01675 [Candidatus Moranbacteria bacterium RIFOXYB12_FULL_35_8]OGI33268.1 MAG: hypothetical protein A2489_01975 [Candidatus Moranbacteria bacterium RIFOXYC12_FULL_36_13]OGI36460.1 MAG: hypothetical protein A2271_00775 [Candidatus Moranbacteria bacterium RIFOXYA12_FULL_35_19]
MDKKSKIFFIVFFLLLAGSVAMTYWRIVIRKDYIIESQADCDPETEACFVWECDPESIVEGEACTGDPESDIWYYKIRQRNAGKIPLCDPQTDETCDPMTCEENEKECGEILCDEETKIEQEVECNDPEQYLLENPIEEEEEETGEEADASNEEGEEVSADEEADISNDEINTLVDEEEITD